MKTILKYFLLTYLLLASSISRAQTSSIQKVSGCNVYDVNGIVPFHQTGITTPSSNQIICFSAQVTDPGKHDIVIMKIDSAGNNLNHKVLTKDPNFHDWTQAFIELGNNYYMTGSSRGFDTSSFSYESSYLLKFDDNLNIISQTNYFLSGRELFAKSITATSDNNILITGSMVFSSNWSFFLLKTDTLGSVIWFKQYGYPQGMDASVVRELANGDIMIAGSFPYGFQFIMPAALRFTGTGNLIWAKIYIYDTNAFANQNSVLKFIHDFGNNRILLAGQTDYSGIASHGFMDSYALMIDNNGSIVWSKTFGEFQSDWSYNYTLSSANQLVITGSTSSFYNFSNFGFVQYIDTTGTLLSSYAFGDTTVQEQITLSGFRELSTNENMLLGFKRIINDFNFYLTNFSTSASGTCPVNPVTFQTLDASSYPVFSYTVPLDSSLTPYTNTDTFTTYQGISDSILCSTIPNSIIENSVSEQSLLVFPNPASDFIYLPASDKKIIQVEFYNITGEKIKSQKINPADEIIYVNKLSAGIYFIKFIASNKECFYSKVQII